MTAAEEELARLRAFTERLGAAAARMGDMDPAARAEAQDANLAAFVEMIDVVGAAAHARLVEALPALRAAIATADAQADGAAQAAGAQLQSLADDIQAARERALADVMAQIDERSGDDGAFEPFA